MLDIHPWHGVDCQTCREQQELADELIAEVIAEEQREAYKTRRITVSSMVPVTRTEYYTFVNNMVAAFGEENVVDSGYAFGRDNPHIIVTVRGVKVAAMNLEISDSTSNQLWFNVSYTIDSGYLSWRDASDDGQMEKPTQRDTVSPFAATLHDTETMKPKPRLLPMRKVSFEQFIVLVREALRKVGKTGETIEDVCNYDPAIGIGNSCYVYNEQIIAQLLYHKPPGVHIEVERTCLVSSVLVLFSYLEIAEEHVPYA